MDHLTHAALKVLDDRLEKKNLKTPAVDGPQPEGDNNSRGADSSGGDDNAVDEHALEEEKGYRFIYTGKLERSQIRKACDRLNVEKCGTNADMLQALVDKINDLKLFDDPFVKSNGRIQVGTVEDEDDDGADRLQPATQGNSTKPCRRCLLC